MIVGERGKFVALGSKRLPPRRPMVAHAGDARLGGFIGREKSGPGVMASEYIGDQLGLLHVPRREGQIDRLST